MKPINLLSLVRRSGQATRRALSRCRKTTVNGSSIRPSTQATAKARRAA